MRDITQFIDKTAQDFAKILPVIGLFLHEYYSHVRMFLNLWVVYICEVGEGGGFIAF